MDADRPLQDLITDPTFRAAVGLMDQGAAASLADLLDAHPDLIHRRAALGAAGMGYFTSPSLLAFIAENPVRQGHLPATVMDVLETLLAADPPQEALSETLILVASGRVMRQAGRQEAAIARLVSAGAAAEPAMLPALSHGEFAAAHALRAAGAPPSLPLAAATGDVAEARALLPKSSPLSRHQALALAAQHGAAATLALLLESGEDPNRFNPEGCHAHTTPLHQAAFFGHSAAVQTLLAAGARNDIPDKTHAGLASDWARHGGHPALEALLNET